MPFEYVEVADHMGNDEPEDHDPADRHGVFLANIGAIDLDDPRGLATTSELGSSHTVHTS